MSENDEAGPGFVPMTGQKARAHPWDHFGDPDDISALILALGGSEDSWTGKFVMLLQKSDPQHLAALRRGCPVLVTAWAAWRDGADGKGRGVINARKIYEALAGDRGML